MRELAKRLLRSDLPLPAFARPVCRGIYRSCVGIKELYILVKKWLIVSPVMRSIAVCGKNLQIEAVPYVRGSGRLQLGDRVRLSGKSNYRFSNRHHAEPLLLIGSDVFIGSGCVFAVAERIEIGDFTMIAGGVSVRDNYGHPVDPAARRRREPIAASDIGPVVIGENVWIGAGATIMKGVKIGDNSIIGAQAVVTNDVEANTVVAGIPARLVVRLDDPSGS